MNHNQAQWALITSFKLKNRPRISYKIAHGLLIRIKLLMYFFINKQKYKKWSNKLQQFKLSGGIKLIGHEGVLLALIRGFKALNIPFTYNKITKQTKYVILLWADTAQIHKITKLKQKQQITVISAPTANGHDYDFQFRFAQTDCIDFSWVASNWVKEFYKSKMDSKYWDKIIVCPSGVDVKPLQISSVPKIFHKCLCYYKGLPINERITEMLQKRGIEICNIEYGKYTYDDYMRILDDVDFVIFHQDMRETQGLAQAEAWAHNKPTLVHYVPREFNSNSSPYLTPFTGTFYNSLEDLEKLLDKYIANPCQFLKQFQPYSWVYTNMSDSSSLLSLIKLITK